MAGERSEILQDNDPFRSVYVSLRFTLFPSLPPIRLLLWLASLIFIDNALILLIFLFAGFLALLMHASIFGVLNNRILLLDWKAPERCLLVLF